MNYLEWNNALGEHFFNENNADKEVLLFLDRQLIHQLAKKNTEEESVQDFLTACKNALTKNYFEWFCTSSNKYWPLPKMTKEDFVSVLKQMLNEGSKREIRIGEIKSKYPLYLSYLCLTVLAITSTPNGNTKPIIQNFLKQNELPILPNMSDNHNWNNVWEALENWSKNKENLGFFYARPILNAGWTYLTYPLSQTLIKPTQKKQIKHFFLNRNFVPKESITQDFTSILEDIQKKLGISVNDDNKDFLLKIIQDEYLHWDGESYEKESENNPNQVTEAGTNVKIVLCFKVVHGEKFEFYYRIQTNSEYPEDFILNGDNISITPKKSNQNYSTVIKNIGFPKEDFILEDKANRWKAIFKSKDLCVFEPASKYGIDGFVATNRINSEGKNYILWKKGKLSENENHDLISWAKSFKNFREFSTLPENYAMISFEQPMSSFSKDKFPELQIIDNHQNNINIHINNVVGIGYRSYLIVENLIPTISLTEGFINPLCILYEGEKEPMYLKYIAEKNVFLLNKEKLKANLKFHFCFENGNKINSLSHQFVELENDFTDINLPQFNKKSELLYDKTVTPYKIGNQIIGNVVVPDYVENIQYRNYFINKFRENVNIVLHNIHQDPYPSENDWLIHVLSHKKMLSFKEFNQIYQTLKSANKNEITIENNEKNSLKYAMRNLGFCSLDLKNEKIYVHKPSLVRIPNPAFPCAILTGFRSPQLVEKIRKEAKNLNVRITITVQEHTLGHLLPLRIQLDADSVQKFETLAKLCNLDCIKLNHPLYLIWMFEGINSIENNLVKADFYYNRSSIWKFFNTNSLGFENYNPNNNDTIALLEQKINPYDTRYWLKKQNDYYPIDKSVGRYIMLKERKIYPLKFDSNQGKLYVPSRVPLPHLIAEGFTLMSGIAPYFTYNNQYLIYENLPEIFTTTVLKEKLCQIPQNHQ
jgi:hypothetical protein